MKRALCGLVMVAHCISIGVGAEAEEEGFKRIFDGRSFAGWRMATENTNTWKVEDDAFVSRGPRCHLFYVGDETPFKDFELKLEVMTEPGSNGGIYFHTRYQETGWPRNGFESQVNVSGSDYKKTGSLYDVSNLGHTPAKDNEWWTHHIVVRGNRVTVRINGVLVLEYIEPPGVEPGRDFTRKLDAGTFGLQAHDPQSVVRYRNIRVKRL